LTANADEATTVFIVAAGDGPGRRPNRVIREEQAGFRVMSDGRFSNVVIILVRNIFDPCDGPPRSKI
jgi:hypothetical protein